jgi:hypothetical protein
MRVRTWRFTTREHTLSSGVSVGFHPNRMDTDLPVGRQIKPCPFSQSFVIPVCVASVFNRCQVLLLPMHNRCILVLTRPSRKALAMPIPRRPSFIEAIGFRHGDDPPDDAA